MAEAVTTSDVIHLYDVIAAAIHVRRVARLIGDHVYVGTARSVSDREGMLPPFGTDVRDLYLRVTLDSGTDTYWPMRDLMTEVNDGTFVANYER